jgi:putative membrane-bound dehydrogenase-like protein
MRVALSILALCFWSILSNSPSSARAADGILPASPDGRVLNLDFETGDLRDWTAQGDAFQGQPIEGDTVFPRRSDMHSKHTGRYWIGSYERAGDRPRGTLTSVPFKLTRPYARFLLAGGSHDNTRVEIVRKDSSEVIFRASGTNSEELQPVVADLSGQVGKELFVRLVDLESGGWGHINFDDFKLWDVKPPEPIRPNQAKPDEFLHAGLDPEAAAKAMTVPPGFKVTLFAGEPDVVQPIAFAIDDRGRLWVAEAYSYPVRVADSKARDRILIFEDVNGDGKFDTRKVFADKLNLVSGIEVGFGGVWVGAAPNLLFIPDRNGDDRPDGPPEILLDGWGYEDTHETLNSFIWGPDGWLYGCHGVFTHSNVGKPGDSTRKRINAGIWRFHPTRHVFEVFAEGTSNPWGLDFDEHGEAFITACVIPHLYHVFEGGRYERQAGAHFDPHTYDDIKTIADHRHYVGSNPHAGNGRSDDAGGGHAHAGAMIYQGGAWPREYQGSLFMNNIHGARLNRDILVPSGSGFIGKHAPDFLLANDQWSQIISIKSGPDGQVYMIDWYDKNQCHHKEINGHDRTNGRIFKVSYKETCGDPKGIDPRTSSLDLVKLLAHTNDWYSRHALRILQERMPRMKERARAGDEKEFNEVNRALETLAKPGPDNRVRLKALWGRIAVSDILPPGLAELSDPDPYVRALAIRKSAWSIDPKQSARVVEMAKTDPSPVVRLEIACSLQRGSPQPVQWDLLEALASHSEDANDHNIPLMVWYGAERLVQQDPARLLKLAMNAKLPLLLPYTVRAETSGTQANIQFIVDMLGKAETDSVRLTLLEGLNTSFRGQRFGTMPSGWAETYEKLSRSKEERVRVQADALALTFSDARALKTLRALLVDSKRDVRSREQALASLLKAVDPELPPVLHALLGEPTLRAQAIRGLSLYNNAETPRILLDLYPRLTPSERHDALTTLAYRPAPARALLEAVGSDRVPSKEVSADVVRLIRNQKDPVLDALITKVWGTARETAADKAALIARYKAMLSKQSSRPPDIELGRSVYARTCQQCHTLFGTGAKIGPDLTGSNRRDLDYVLSNVIDPSALIGKDYVAHVIATADGRTLTGLIKSQDKNALTLQTANEEVVIPLSEIEAERTSDQSMMPEGQWQALSEHEIRSLVLYLKAGAQTNYLATSENASGLFNGRDLAGWEGDLKLWTVDKGEIVGKTSGLKRNAFLRSELSAEDFTLSVQIKLVNNEGNSGIQFRSQPLPEGEIKGYQADVGAGWWGKLYEENGRALLWAKSGEEFIRPGEWNSYRIEAAGSRIRTFLNGKPCVDLDDPPGARRGIFAFQLHSGGATEVRIRDLKLEVVPSRESDPR